MFNRIASAPLAGVAALPLGAARYVAGNPLRSNANLADHVQTQFRHKQLDLNIAADKLQSRVLNRPRRDPNLDHGLGRRWANEPVVEGIKHNWGVRRGARSVGKTAGKVNIVDAVCYLVLFLC